MVINFMMVVFQIAYFQNPYIFCQSLLFSGVKIMVGHQLSLFTELDYWTGILDWTTGLDHWTGVVSFFGQGSMILVYFQIFDT